MSSFMKPFVILSAIKLLLVAISSVAKCCKRRGWKFGLEGICSLHNPAEGRNGGSRRKKKHVDRKAKN